MNGTEAEYKTNQNDITAERRILQDETTMASGAGHPRDENSLPHTVLPNEPRSPLFSTDVPAVEANFHKNPTTPPPTGE